MKILRADKELIKELKISPFCANCNGKAKYIIIEKFFLGTIYWQFCTKHTKRYLKESGISEQRINKILEKVVSNE
jgi:hypothetical protein